MASRGRSRSLHVARIVRSVIKEATERGIAVHIVSTADIRTSLGERNAGVRNKAEVIGEIVKCYPELYPAAPRARVKVWDPERHLEPLFHAIAMYLAWQRQPSPNETRQAARPVA